MAAAPSSDCFLRHSLHFLEWGGVKLAHKVELLWEKWGRIASLLGQPLRGGSWVERLGGGAAGFALCTSFLVHRPDVTPAGPPTALVA